MNFHALKFLADENIHPSIVDYLKLSGLDAISIAEHHLNGKPDNEILELAFNKNRVVLTQDADFGKLIFTSSTDFIGIVYLRPAYCRNFT